MDYSSEKIIDYAEDGTQEKVVQYYIVSENRYKFLGIEGSECQTE